MVENLMIQSIESDNRNIVNFSDKYLPRFGRHGELFVVNGILYILIIVIMANGFLYQMKRKFLVIYN